MRISYADLHHDPTTAKAIIVGSLLAHALSRPIASMHPVAYSQLVKARESCIPGTLFLPLERLKEEVSSLGEEAYIDYLYGVGLKIHLDGDGFDTAQLWKYLRDYPLQGDAGDVLVNTCLDYMCVCEEIGC